MSLSDDFRKFRREFGPQARARDPRRPNRWNTIGRTRRRLAEILTTYVQSLMMPDGYNGSRPRYPGAVVLPENIKPMRLAGRARAWEDAHSWDAIATWPDGDHATRFYSFDTMTACVRSKEVHPVGKGGEVSA